MTDQPFSVKIPDGINNLPQDKEYCILFQDGHQRKLRLHDYHEIYGVPGLYEHLFYNILRCQSPEVVTTNLVKELEKSSDSPSELVVLDLGAGNGMVGEALQKKGVETIVGIDIIEEAAFAAERDRPGIYQEYFVEDLCALPHPTEEFLNEMNFNCLISVAALGFGDIPPEAFASAFNLIADEGWVAFNIKTDFLEDESKSGFAQLLKLMREKDFFEVHSTQKYRHRLALDGNPLYYMAVVGKKSASVPEEIIQELAF